MSLLYIIDGYNIISHTKFPHTNKNIKDPRRMLLEFIKRQRLAGSPRNKIAVVFDGYPNLSSKNLEGLDIDIIFSRKETADDRIKRMVETLGNPRNIVVVSDDKQIQFFIKASGARSMGVEEFIKHKVNLRDKLRGQEKDLFKPELSYAQADKINQELKGIWLKD